MARRQRHNQVTVHIPRAPVKRNLPADYLAERPDEPLYIIHPICGDTYVSETVATPELPTYFRYSDYQRFTFDPMDHRICSKCQSKALHTKHGGEFEGLKMDDRLDLSGDNRPWGLSRYTWKSVYPVRDTAILADEREEQIVAFICIENGWGKSWEIHGWTPNSRARDMEANRIADPVFNSSVASRTIVHEEYERHDGTKSPRSEMKADASRIPSKEAALLLIPNMLKREQLKTFGQCRKDDENNLRLWREATEKREREAQDRQREREERDRQARLDLDEVAEALREIALLDLTNFQRDGLLRAAKRLGIDVEKPPAMVSVMEADEEGWKI